MPSENQPKAGEEKPKAAAPKGDEPTGPSAQEFAELQAENARLKAANEQGAQERKALDQRLTAIERNGLRGVINTFAEKALKDGKLNKGDMDAGVEAFMEAIDGVSFKAKDAEGTEVEHSARHWFSDFVERRVTAVPQGMVGNGERTGTGTTVGDGGGQPVDVETVNFNERADAYAREHKVSHAEAVRKLGGLSNRYRSSAR